MFPLNGCSKLHGEDAASTAIWDFVWSVQMADDDDRPTLLDKFHASEASTWPIVASPKGTLLSLLMYPL